MTLMRASPWASSGLVWSDTSLNPFLSEKVNACMLCEAQQMQWEQSHPFQDWALDLPMHYKKGPSDTDRHLPHEQHRDYNIVTQKSTTQRLYLHKSGAREEARGFGAPGRDDAG